MKDARLPQLRAILDAKAIAAMLEEPCRAQYGAASIVECRVGHVRYKPEKRCLVRYDLSLDGAQTSRQLMWYGLAYEPGTSESRYEKAKRGAGPGEIIVHLERLGMVLWAFPSDRKLRGLEVMADAADLSQEVFGSRSIPPARTELVRYIPEHGCTVRLTAADSRRYYAKLTTAGDTASICAHARAMGREAWVTPNRGVIVQAEIPGVPATGVDDLEKCAAALARLHQQPISGLPPGPDPTSSMQIEGALRILAAHSSAGWLLDEIANRWPGPTASATVHGDLHLKNFLVSGDSAQLIDLDTLHSGDPLEDVGSFAASLYHRALLSQAGVAAADAAIAQFLHVYAQSVPWNLQPEHIATHVARALVTERACRAITRCKGDVVEPLLAIARRILHRQSLSSRTPITARDWMEEFHAYARIRTGVVLDVDYRTYIQSKSWPKSSVTVTWRDAAGIHVERIGPEPAKWDVPPAPQPIIDHLPVPDAERVEAELVNYRPGCRLAARYRVVTRAGVTRKLFGKSYTDCRGEAIYERMAQLYAASFPMPRPLGYSAAVRTVWQETFEGEPLLDALTGVRQESLIEDAASRVAHLHSSYLTCPTRPTLVAQHADLAKKLAKLAATVPQHAARLIRITEQLAAALDGLPPAEACVVHGDLHIGQFRVDGGEVVLFDYDEISIGDPCEDLAAFTANLHGMFQSGSRASEIADSLIAAYTRRPGAHPISETRLRWHTAVQLLTRAYRALIQLRPDFDRRIDRNLHLAEQLL